MFAQRLKHLRKEMDLTQSDLAKTLGVSGGTVAMWETGKRMPRFDTLNKLSDVFNKRMDYILGASDDASSVRAEPDVDQALNDWLLREESADAFRVFSMLDSFGQAAVQALLRAEYTRCREQQTLRDGVRTPEPLRTAPDDAAERSL